MRHGGACYIADTIAEVLSCIDAIEARNPNPNMGGRATMSPRVVLRCLLALIVLLSAPSALAQMANPYGAPISLESAKKAAAAAVAEAKKNNWAMSVAITDAAGDLVYFEKMDGNQTGSVNLSIDKARSAVRYKRPSKVWADLVGAGGDNLRLMVLQGIVPSIGGIPLVMDGKIVGGIGVSGGTGAQDGQCAQAGADVLK
jgi:glc operon protein GlcG